MFIVRPRMFIERLVMFMVRHRMFMESGNVYDKT